MSFCREMKDVSFGKKMRVASTTEEGNASKENCTILDVTPVTLVSIGLWLYYSLF